MGGQIGGALDKNCGAFCKKNCWRFLALFGKIMALLNLKQLTTLTMLEKNKDSQGAEDSERKNNGKSVQQS